jgi:hypothetical protein
VPGVDGSLTVRRASYAPRRRLSLFAFFFFIVLVLKIDAGAEAAETGPQCEHLKTLGILFDAQRTSAHHCYALTGERRMLLGWDPVCGLSQRG